MGNGDSDATATFETTGSFSLSEDDDDDDDYDDSDVEAALEKDVTELQQPRTFMMHVSEFQKKCCPPVHLAPGWCRGIVLCFLPLFLPFLGILPIIDERWYIFFGAVVFIYLFCVMVWVCKSDVSTSIHQNRSTAIPSAIPFAMENGNEKSDEGTVTLVRSQTTSGHVAG